MHCADQKSFSLKFPVVKQSVFGNSLNIILRITFQVYSILVRVVLPYLSHRRMVGALSYMHKLHCIPPSHPVASLLPGPAVAAPNPRTRRSSIAHHPHQLQHDHPARTGIYGDSPTPPRRHGMCYRHLSCSTGPSSRDCRLLKTKSTATSSIPTG